MKRTLVAGTVALATFALPVVAAAPASAAAGPVSSYCSTVMRNSAYTNEQTAWCRVQQWTGHRTVGGGYIAEGPYQGPIDGIPGVNSWRAFQQYLKLSVGYSGPIDGIPGPNTYRAVQLLAQKGGYTGPVDGVLGPNTWAGVARYVLTKI
ncbi:MULTISPECIES: peptidoglycan-binding domain-containing protein [Oerskovia]|uniref:Peptidoglycan-binding protein n=1 Tax=Oerskovia rustica TaxID=2762237 RepID=A0ABR8RXV5_9CELL|nr:peptidoglycan-binding domain-containing protein [Oerskovia rustica]MBD7952452.1 peptidoglycan-binding protein [Oerskovia rustica]